MSFDRDILVQAFFGVLVLGGAVAAVHARCVRPIASTLDRRGRRTLFLVVLTLCGGAVGACGWWIDDPRSFSWDLPPLASRVLGAAGFAFAWLSYETLRKPTWPAVSLTLFALVVYLAPIGVAALAWHRERFDPRAPITYAFFALVAGMTAAASLFLAAPSAALRAREETGGAPGTWARAQLVVAALVLLPWSVALFVTDAGPTRLVWAWPGDLLTSRLVSVMLLTLGACCLASLRSLRRARMCFAFQLVYGLGVVAAGAVQGWKGKPVPVAYVSVFAALAVTAAAARVSSRNRP